ncbi:MAG: hypothetical protein Q7J45_03955 [bacterium]|nr:hypothetical protein [bacterium]
MSGKSVIWGGMLVGSTIGQFIPYLWGGDLIEYAIWGAIGGFAGIWVGFKLAKMTGAL